MNDKDDTQGHQWPKGTSSDLNLVLGRVRITSRHLLVPSSCNSQIDEERIPQVGKDSEVALSSYGWETEFFSHNEGKLLLHWMKQKHDLHQDIFLVGSGGPLRRWLALHFCSIEQRDFEYIPLTRDTTESGITIFKSFRV